MRQPPAVPLTQQSRAEADRVARLAREAAALRDNLRRRKQQSRAREEEPDQAPPRLPEAPDHDPA